MNNNKRLPHTPPDTHHRIRELAYFRMIHESDLVCLQSTRMDRRTFTIICHLLRNVAGLSSTEIVDVEEMVAMFLHVLAHDVKNRVIQREFVRFGETVSRHFNIVLLAVLRLYEELIKRPVPVTNGTYIKVNVPAEDQPTFRTRKGEIATNVLGVCDTKGDFVYVLAGWEGSAADSRILCDALSRENGLQVPKGYYYLCDAEGFLAPYRGQRYHLQESRGAANEPTNAKEYFNMKHSSARNVIERAFGVLKDRWAILRGKSYYPLFDIGDGNEDFPPVYSQGIDLSQDDVRASRPSRALEGRNGSSGSKRKRGSQRDFDVEAIHLALDQTNEQLRQIAEWPARNLANDNHVRTEFFPILREMPELTSLDRALLQRHLLSRMDDLRSFILMPEDEREGFCRILLRDIER
ncbi:retrotransposon protein [Cucumis melo var. makuwa]|uniref:Retrotransposon protein n=1 Tax=Cucumis melo var. makuwa TaxID=1194695 RepID=A0A5A7SQE9_CUCMM|nr:retrotransposon protein [Cucumis melo var. makuwa]